MLPISNARTDARASVKRDTTEDKAEKLDMPNDDIHNTGEM